jgi:tetratricopeptide (TPR) repeat protein
MLEGAEQNAEKYSMLACEASPDSPVALSLLASVRLSQNRNDEASRILDDAHAKLYSNPDTVLSYPERLHLVKLFIETEKYGKALEVLETLQREDEDNVELWYYYTVAYFSDVNDSTREENWKNAGECAEMCLKLYNKMEWDDELLKEGCLQMLDEIKKAGISLEKEDEYEDGVVDDDEWADTDEDVDMEDA